MSDGEAIETLLHLLSGSRAATESHAGIEKHMQLLSLLENLPLAIAQAAAYMNNMDMTVSEYLELFTRAQPKLLSKPLMMVEHKERASAAVMTTWNITLDNIETTNPTSVHVQLLELMSLFNCEDIPEDLIRGTAFFENQCEIVFYDTLEPLIAYSLIYRLRGSSSFRLHRLVSLWVRIHMDLEDSQRKRERLQIALELVILTIPKDLDYNLQKCLQLKPHAVAVLTYCDSIELELSTVVVKLLGDITKSEGAYVEALKWYQQALKDMEKTCGNDDPSLLTTINNIGTVFVQQAKYNKALE